MLAVLKRHPILTGGGGGTVKYWRKLLGLLFSTRRGLPATMAWPKQLAAGAWAMLRDRYQNLHSSRISGELWSKPMLSTPKYGACMSAWIRLICRPRVAGY